MEDSVTEPKGLLPQLIESHGLATLLNLVFIGPMHVFLLVTILLPIQVERKRGHINSLLLN